MSSFDFLFLLYNLLEITSIKYAILFSNCFKNKDKKKTDKFFACQFVLFDYSESVETISSSSSSSSSSSGSGKTTGAEFLGMAYGFSLLIRSINKMP